MTLTIELDDAYELAVRLAAKAAGISERQYVESLVHDTAAATGAQAPKQPCRRFRLFAVYGQIRHEAECDASTGSITITAGPLAGRTFKSATASARAVVSHTNPSINPSKNGLAFWKLNDGTGRNLKSVLQGNTTSILS
jgi:hypothetical protein